MKTTYRTNLDLMNIDIGLLIFRVIISGIMLTHGVPKLLDFFGSDELKFADPIGIGEGLTFGFAVFAEFVCSVFIIFGFLTRLASIPLIFTMTTAAFVIHFNDPFADKELPILFLAGFILLLITGAGKYSLDFFLSKKK